MATTTAAAAAALLASPSPPVVGEQQQKSRSQCSTRRMVVATLALSLVLQRDAGVAAAKDVPLFGIKKKREVPPTRAPVPLPGPSPSPGPVAEDVKPPQPQASVAAFPSSAPAAAGSTVSVTPAVQAGAVLAAEVVGVAVASSIVNGLVGRSSN